jgi:hypothetical protein
VDVTHTSGAHSLSRRRRARSSPSGNLLSESFCVWVQFSSGRVADGELPQGPLVLILYRATAALSHEQSALTYSDALSEPRFMDWNHLRDRLPRRSLCHGAA